MADDSALANMFPQVPDPGCPVGRDACAHIEHIKQEWESTADALPQLICLLDATGAVVRTNRIVEQWGLGRVAAVKGRSLHALLHPGCTQPDCYLKRFVEAAHDRLAQGAEAHCQAEDPALGRHLDIRLRAHRPRSAAGMPQGETFAVAVVADITELKAAEGELLAINRELDQRVAARTAQLDEANRWLSREALELEHARAALQQSRDKYQLLVETMSEGLAVKDRNGAVNYVNQSLARMLGYPTDEIVGRSVDDFIDPTCLEKWTALMAQRQNGEVAPYELLLVGNGGRRIWVRISPSRITDDDGNYTGSIAVITDISEQVKADLALREYEKELRLLSTQVLSAQEKERQRIASELHDGIGQTLSAIKFYVEHAMTQLTGCPTQAGAPLFACVVPRLQQAIEEVRRISMDLRPSILDDLGILATLGWFCREYQASHGGIRVELHTEACEADIPEALKVTIFRIVQEGLNNVAKHAQSDTVRITLACSAGAITLEIADEGVGFDPSEIAAKRGRCIGGAGLVSMRERSEYSGGRFSVKSRKGHGTRIRIVWAEGATPTEPAAPSP